MIFGGRLESGALLNDTWGWNGTTWRELNAGRDDLPPNEGAVMAWDAARHAMVLVTPSPTGTGGETWTWSASGWLRQPGGDTPATPIAAQMAFDPVSRTVLFVSPLMPPSGVGVTTWRWNGSSWHQLAAIPPVATTGLAVDPTSGHLVLCADPTAAAPARLWSWDGATWALVPNSELSVALDVEVADNDRGQFLMFGSLGPSTQLDPQPVHVWGWNGRVWRRLDS